jgi:hypothetical protein
VGNYEELREFENTLQHRRVFVIARLADMRLEKNVS